VVALLAAIAPDEARARMTSTFNRTKSSANCGSWSRLPSVDRNSQTRFRCYDGRAAMPFIPPMLATRLEDTRRLADPRLIAEPKLDGQRAQLTCATIAPSTPSAAPAGADPRARARLAAGAPLARRVSRARRRGGRRPTAARGFRPSSRRAPEREPMAFAAFDLLGIDSHGVTGEPWTARRKRLEDCSRRPHPASASSRRPTTPKAHVHSCRPSRWAWCCRGPCSSDRARGRSGKERRARPRFGLWSTESVAVGAGTHEARSVVTGAGPVPTRRPAAVRRGPRA
jgi:hypothetical protein